MHLSLLSIAIPDFFLNKRTPWVAHALDKTLYIEKRAHGLFRFRIGDDQFVMISIPSQKWLSQSLALSNKNRILAYRGIGRIVDPKWIDVRLLRNWKTRCEVQHGDSCELIHKHLKLSQHFPSLLIDTWRMCLTKNLSVKSYVALSYVWGKVLTMKTIQTNLEVLQQNGSLRREEIASKLTKTVRDAIAITELLHERYLWVDSLCIVQDDKTTSHDQITKMASIYANAALTIVAADGEDADYGLRGIRGVSHPRSHPQQIGELPHGVQAIKPTFVSYEDSSWSKQGWTFQESLFSRRRLIFNNNCVMWECLGPTIHEDFDCPNEPSELTISNIDRFLSPSYVFSLSWPDILRYQRLVNDFNPRDFTYPEDVIDAFSGITTPLSKVFQGGFLYGLPELFFDVALLWYSWQPMTRRIPKCSTNSNLRVPSWSWMGWRGNIDTHSWGSGADYIDQRPFESPMRTCIRTVPLVQWSAHNKHKGTRQMNLSWLVYRNLSMVDKRYKLPPGWKRYRYAAKLEGKDYKDFPNHGIPSYFFKHDSDNIAKFWYPVPISGELNGWETSELSPFISCRTTRCWFNKEAYPEPIPLLDRAVIPNFKPPLTLRDSIGTWAGILIVHNFIDPEMAQCETMTSPETAEIELIAISKGYVHSGTMVSVFELLEWNHPERPKSFEFYEFYNVLWIEWKDGLAYRKGIGRVEKHMWESQPLEWVDVTLS
jgi:hypothetical protein